MNATRAIGLILLATVTAATARADWQIDAETGALYDSNLSNSQRASDVKDDWDWQTNLRVGNGFQLSRDLRLNITGDMHADKWARFDDFDNIAPGGAIALRYRFGLGRDAPWIAAEDNISYAFFRDHGRSGRDNVFRIRGGLGFCERFAVEAGYTFEDFDAKEDIWTWSAHTGAIRLTYDATSSLQLGLGYSYRDGVFISYAKPPRPDIAFLTPERELVDTFGSPPYMAYRLRGPTHGVSATASYTLNKYVSVQVGYEFNYTAHQGFDYVNHFFEAKIGFAY